MTDPLSLLVPILTLLKNVVTDQRKARQEETVKIYKSVVQESFRGLEIIHQDYSTNLSALRQHLLARSLPPQELIRWLRETGLQHRALRESLRTLEEETKLLEGKFNPEVSNEGNFYWHVHRYVKAVLEYFAKGTSYSQLSFYRDYGHQLGILLWSIEQDRQEHGQSDRKNYSDAVKDIFYEADFVQDMNDTLLRITDKVLPEQWQNVVREYRSVRAAAGYPS